MRGDPVTVSEIPHPRRLPQPLPFVESDEWFACGPPPAGADQGWKLYVPLTLANAREMVERLAPLVHGFGLHFKYIKSLKLLRKLNAGMFGYTQIGKCFVIYLPAPDGGFLAALKEALAPFRDQCPAVPCARPFGGGLPLYYRYGAYHGRRLVLGGATVDDDREDAGAAVPPGVDDPIAPVNQYNPILARSWSRVKTVSMFPSQSDQARNFSTIQAARPAGESVRAKASVCGRVP